MITISSVIISCILSTIVRRTCEAQEKRWYGLYSAAHSFWHSLRHLWQEVELKLQRKDLGRKGHPLLLESWGSQQWLDKVVPIDFPMQSVLDEPPWAAVGVHCSTGPALEQDKYF